MWLGVGNFHHETFQRSESGGLYPENEKGKVTSTREQNQRRGPLSQFSLVQSFSRVRLFATPWIAARQASLSLTNSRSVLKLMFIELVMPSSHLIFCHPLLLLPQIPPYMWSINHIMGNLKVREFWRAGVAWGHLQPQGLSYLWLADLKDNFMGYSK